ncbi:MAG TPA: phosphotransferase [Gaiellaceae bacterium]|nr:phosphotransferase [Gaiellaceae bacterium]
MGVRTIDDGYDFRVLVLDDTWVLRIPRRPGVVRALETEVALLPALAPALPVRVPEFEHVSAEPPFVVYRLIEGEPLRDEEARPFLETLHAFDPAGLPVPREDWVEAYRRQAAEFRRVVLPLLDVDERPRAEALFAEVETLVGFEPALVHGDLGPEHLRCREGRLVGVIDWGDARVGDPALDYAWLLNVAHPEWDAGPELRRRARFYHRLGPWYEAHHGVATGRPAHVEAGLRGIRERL